MKIIEHILNITSYDFRHFPAEIDLSQALFFDIETTGLSANTSHVYLIGIAYYTDHAWKLIQFFAQSFQDELLILQSFLSYTKSFSYLVSYNGETFDIPYLKTLCQKYYLEEDFGHLQSIDIYKLIRPYKKYLPTENLKQVSVETLFDIRREGDFTGGELIHTYHQYLKNQDEELADIILKHNFYDLHGLLHIVRTLDLQKLSTGHFTYHSSDIQKDILTVYYTKPESFAIPLYYQKDLRGYFDACNFSTSISLYTKDSFLILEVPCISMEAFYYFENYKDYEYLIYENMPIHKSLSAFVDKSAKRKIKKEEAYIKKTSKYLPIFEGSLPLPVKLFRVNYKSSLYLVDIQELQAHGGSLPQDSYLQIYADSLLASMLSSPR